MVMFAQPISALARVRKLLMVCVAQSYEHARYQTSRGSEPLIRRDLHWERYGLNPDVRPYRGTDHIRAQIHEPCMLALGLNATKQSSTLRWQLSTHALSLDINEEVNHSPA